VEVALDEGRYFQATPDFGAERSGAPVAAYTRISDEPIYSHTPITNPDIVVVLDSTLIGRVDFLSGLAEDGLLLVNTRLSPQEIREQVEAVSQRVCTVDATRIAMETIGRNIPNVPTLGALLRVDEVVSYQTALSAIERRLRERFSDRVVKANMEALERGYKEVRTG
jgi:pyruvate ferredoxin oxidoreductase gamma subunit